MLSSEFQCYYYYYYYYYYYPQGAQPQPSFVHGQQHGYGDHYSPFVAVDSHDNLIPPPPPLPPPTGGYRNYKNPRSKHATTDNATPSSLHLANCTTVMVKNIPNTLRRRDLIYLLDHHCRQHNSKLADNPFPFRYDFLYLPFDFQHKQNLGYAFVNFTSVEGAVTLHNCWTGKGWESCSKIRQITPAKLQGLERCKKHFQVSIFHCLSEEYLPVEFSPPRDGLNGHVCKTMIVGTLAHRPNAAAPKSKLGNAFIANPPKPKPAISAPPKPSSFKHHRVIPPRLYSQLRN